MAARFSGQFGVRAAGICAFALALALTISGAYACGSVVGGASGALSVSGLAGDCVAVEPSGTISVSSNDPLDNATGIIVNGDTELSGITNAGTISATNTGSLPLFREPGPIGSATGLNITDLATSGQYFGVTITKGIASSGSITATTTANVPSMGIVIGDPRSFFCISFGGPCGPLEGIFINVSGGITNSGVISATSALVFPSAGPATAILVSQIASFSGGIANTGTISAITGDVATALAANTGNFSGDIFNSGLISASGVYATGVAIGGSAFYTNFNGMLVNTGTITASGDTASGLSIRGETVSFGGVMNSGTIAATAIGSATAIARYGGGFDINFSSAIVNHGTVVAMANPTNGTALGINLQGSPYTITNTGSIIATGASGTALRLGTPSDYVIFPTEITNTGLIEGSTAAIDTTNAGKTTLNAEAGIIIGAINMADSDTLNISGGTISGDISGPATTTVALGGSGILTYADAISNVGTFNLNNGTLLLQQGASITSVGTYRQASAATLGLAIAPATSGAVISSNLLSITGTLEVVPVAGRYAPSETFRDIIAGTTAPQGTFSAVTTLSPLFSASVVQDGDGFDLTLVHVPAAIVPGLSTNEVATENGVEAVAGLPEAQSLVTPLYVLNRSNLAQALDVLAPRAQADSMNAVHSLFDDITDAIETRLALGSGEEIESGSGIRIAQLGAPANLPGSAVPWHMWTRGFGGWGRAAITAAATGYHDQRAGVIAGVDVRTRPAVVLGGLLALSHADLHLADGGESIASDSYQAALYGQFAPRPWYATVAAGLGWNTSNESRNIQFPGFDAAAGGNYAGQSYSAYGEAGYDAGLGKAKVTPLLGLRYSHLQSDAYGESGAGAADLDVAAADADSLASLLGVRASGRLTLGGVTLIPEASVIWQRELLSPGESVTAAFAAAPGVAFTTEGVQFGRDTALLAAGVSGAASERTSLFVDYQLALNRIVTAQSVSAGLRFNF